MKKIILISILFLFTFLVTDIAHTFNHELAHQQTAVYHGCLNGTLKINILGGSFQCHNYLNRTSEQINNQYVLDSFNEIVSYNVSTVNLVIVLCSLIISILICEKCQ